MALFSEYTDGFKNLEMLTSTTDKRYRLIWGTPCWEVETVERGRFGYFFLTEAAAEAATIALTAAWTKTRVRYGIKEPGGEVMFSAESVLVADIKATRRSDIGWDVIVTVNDRVMTLERYTPPEPE